MQDPQTISTLAVTAGTGLALYVGHHVGDYWVQTDHQAKHKGDAGSEGALQCALHVLSYLMTQVVTLFILSVVTGVKISVLGITLALLVSGGTHYLADRREHGLMVWLARRLPSTADFLKLGVPRPLTIYAAQVDGTPRGPDPLDNPSLGTGAWALDQSWHIFWGVFVPALILGALS
jgi:hypothetical protein